MIATGNPNIFLAASLRSGSTQIATSLCSILNFRMGRVNGLHGEGVEEQNINLISASILMPYGKFVFQQHTKATPQNLQCIRNFNNCLIVLTRNILDSLLSLREWINSPDWRVIPGLVLPEDWKQWKEDNQWDWLVRNAVPWYLAFCYSWLSVDPEPYWIDYDQYYANQYEGMLGILNHFKVPAIDSKAVRLAVSDRSYVRTGKSGRGVTRIPENFQRDVEAQIDAWGPQAKAMREKLL